MTALLERPAAVRSRGAGSGWRPALRIAWRELRRAPGRSLVVLLMVLLPVTGVVALDTLVRTADVSPAESLPGELGDADARVELLPGGGALRQSPDGRSVEAGEPAATPVDVDAVRRALPATSRLLLVRDSQRERGIRAADGRVARALLVGVDLSDPDLRGPYAVLSGRPPTAADEVAVSPELARFGFRPGAALVLPGGAERRVTGTVHVPPSLFPARAVVGLPEALGLQDSEVRWIYTSGADITWDEVLAVNELGGIVLSRAVLSEPPSDDQVPELTTDGSLATTAAILGLIAVMAVLEVVLLAGPAFAVGARRQRRALALLAATGGEPRHVRRVVLAQGLLVGLAAAVGGALLGVAVAAVAAGPARRWTGGQWGPLEVSLRDVVLFAALGAGTAVLAALAPAVLAARRPVVESLQDRRPSPMAAAVPTALGLLLLFVGVLLCLASLGRSSPELLIAFSALPTVIGAVLLAPALLRVLGRAAGRLPLPLRYAVRDADRQRARTAPAVAAIAATVAAVVALGTAAGSDDAQRRAEHAPSGPPGAAVVTVAAADDVPADWTALQAAAREVLPETDPVVVRGLPLGPMEPAGTFEEVVLCRAETASGDSCEPLPTSYGGGLGSSVLVGATALDVLAPQLVPSSVAAARRALADGAVVAFDVRAVTAQLRRQRQLPPPDGGQVASEVVAQTTATLVPVRTRGPYAPALAVVPEDVARRLGGAATVALVLGQAVTQEQEEALQEALALVDGGASVSVERGPRDDGRTVVLLLGLGAGLLVLGGTLAATSLALVEARPDLTVLGQVGARPRTRRAVAGAYAAVLALAGTALGVVGGAVPGVTAALALTRSGIAPSGPAGLEPPSAWRYVEVPEVLLVGLAVLLPAVAAAAAALGVRTRTPSHRQRTG